MVNWKDDAVVRVCARSFALCACAGFGMYIWEFVLALRFDLDHLTGRRQFKWTFIPYILARYCILIALLGGVRISNAYGSDINCVAWNQVVYGFAHITFVFASLLLLLRVLAVAQHDRKITIPLILFYLANVGGLVHGIVESDSVHRPDIDVCMAVNTHASLLNVTMSFAFDTTCLIVMIAVLWRTKAGGSLWHFLMSQGVMYFIVTAGSYLPPVIFLILDLNDPMNEIPQAFAGQ